jgi:uncharacterized protein YkwD
MRKISKKRYLTIAFGFVLLLTATSTIVAKNNIKSSSSFESIKVEAQTPISKNTIIEVPATNDNSRQKDQPKQQTIAAKSQVSAKKSLAKTPSPNSSPNQASAASASTPTSTPIKNAQITEIIYCINLERQKVGLSNVIVDPILNSAALAKSTDMAKNNYFAHTSPNGVSDISFVNNSGYKYQAVGINLAMGDFGSSKALVAAWMNSEGHKKNILADFGEQIGIGINGKYFTMMVARPL